MKQGYKHKVLLKNFKKKSEGERDTSHTKHLHTRKHAETTHTTTHQQFLECVYDTPMYV